MDYFTQNIHTAVRLGVNNGSAFLCGQPLVLLKKLIVEKNVTAEAGSLMNKAGTASSDTIIYAVIVLSIIPIMLVYPYVQKFFRKGITLGAVKG